MVAQAVEGLEPGQAVKVSYNAPDVKRDLVVWANDRGHTVQDNAGDRLRVTRRRA